MTDATHSLIVNWQKGLDVDDENIDGVTRRDAVRPRTATSSTRGRSRSTTAPTLTPKVVVYYGGNDGVLRAINGNRAPASARVTAGREIWSFMPPEFFGSIKRLRRQQRHDQLQGQRRRRPDAAAQALRHGRRDHRLRQQLAVRRHAPRRPRALRLQRHATSCAAAPHASRRSRRSCCGRWAARTWPDRRRTVARLRLRGHRPDLVGGQGRSRPTATSTWRPYAEADADHGRRLRHAARTPTRCRTTARPTARATASTCSTPRPARSSRNSRPTAA